MAMETPSKITASGARDSTGSFSEHDSRRRLHADRPKRPGARNSQYDPHNGNSGLSLDDPLQFLKGVGPQAATVLGKIGLRTVADLLRHIPRRWEDRTNFQRVAGVRGGETVSVCGVVIAASTKYPKPRLQITEALLDDGGCALKLVWFN